MKTIDVFVARKGWMNTAVDEKIGLEHLAFALTSLRKAAMDPQAEEVKAIVNGYLFHVQSRVLEESSGHIALNGMLNSIEKSKANIEALKS